MRSFRRLTALACFLIGLNALLAVDFDDLKEKQGKVYGSEKEKRYVIDAFFVEWESFPRLAPTHNSYHFFWLYNTADYPKYARSQFFPFYYSETSKVDERYEANHSLIRAAAKNHAFVTVATSPSQYDAIAADLQGNGGTSDALRLRLAARIQA